MTRGTRRLLLARSALLAAVFVTAYAYFYEGGGWNQNTRFDLVRAIVEQGTLRIDAYHQNTGDKAHAGAHYYTDKAPGASLTAVPAVALVRRVLRTAGIDVFSDRTVEALAYVATVAAAGLPAAVAAVCVFLVAVRLGASPAAGAFASLVCGLGTPLWAYATILYGHTLAAGSLMLAFVAAERLASSSSPMRDRTLALVTGLAAGWAVVAEYPAAIPSSLLVVFALWQSGRRAPASLRRVVIALSVGLAASAAVLFVYNWVAFGAPFHVGYTSEDTYEGMKTGILGVSWPKMSAARELLVGTYRGLLPLSPVLVVAPLGFWMLWRTQTTRAAALVAAGVAAYYFLLTAGYAYWEGGWSYGSRHLGPGLPFLCVGLAPALMRRGRVFRVLVLALACVGVSQSLIAVATTPQPPAQFTDPMRQLLWPAFRSGDFPIGWQSILELGPPAGSMSELERTHVPRASWNAGKVVGLTGLASLLPLLSIWLIGAGVWGLIDARGGADQASRSAPPLPQGR